MKIQAFLFFYFSAIIAIGQKDYALNIMDTLCSDHFAGRGYVEGGDIRAGDFIKNELENIGVQPFHDKGFEQSYTFNVNTFPYDVEVILGEDTLIPGVDYLIDSHSGTAQGDFELIEINSQNLSSMFGGDINLKNEAPGQKIYALNFTDIKDPERIKELRQYAYRGMKYFPIIWVETNKQMYTVGRRQFNYPLITIDSASYHNATSASLKINNQYIPKYESKNIIGMIPGKKKKKYVVFTGHYDHLGKMGQAIFPGANDNASGVAMLLSLAKYYQANQPKYTTVFCFFSGEEAGLEGSRYFVEHPWFKLKKVKFVLNIDIMGSADEGITIVNGTQHQKHFERMVSINDEQGLLKQVKRRGPTANSDHYFFTQAGVPAFFIYSMGQVKNYHDVYDKAENTPLEKFDEVQQLLVEFVKTL